MSSHEPLASVSPRSPETADQPQPVPPAGSSLGGFIRDLLETIIPAVLLALVISHFVAQGTYVEGQSMEPNLHNEQRLIVEKVSYHLHPPRRGDIIVINVDFSDVPLIKRVIGLPGETVSIRDSQVFIDGQPLEEAYLPTLFMRDYGPTQVPPDCVFVMGDNRGASNDSRAFGPVLLDSIVGRAWVSYWPPEDLGIVR
jgi:signal peptidase I